MFDLRVHFIIVYFNRTLEHTHIPITSIYFVEIKNTKLEKFARVNEFK